jgi:hypothetical protein
LNTREVAQQYRLNQWIERISSCRSSGQTVAVWCAENSINTKSYYYWLKRVRTAACEALPSLKTEGNSIVPINIPIQAGSNSAPQETSAAIVVRFGAVTLEIGNDASPSLIENTLRALQYAR